MDRILIILKTNGPRASSAPAICSRSQVSIYRTLVLWFYFCHILSDFIFVGCFQSCFLPWYFIKLYNHCGFNTRVCFSKTVCKKCFNSYHPSHSKNFGLVNSKQTKHVLRLAQRLMTKVFFFSPFRSWFQYTRWRRYSSCEW